MTTLIHTELKISQLTTVDSSLMTSFAEQPRKTGDALPVDRIDAFDLFSLFTADVIRSNTVFTR